MRAMGLHACPYRRPQAGRGVFSCVPAPRDPAGGDRGRRRARGGGPLRLDAFPVATFLVNVVGAVILGAVVALPADWLAAHELTRPAIGTGFCGGLTTFSTMTLEIYQRSSAHSTLAAVYAVTSLLAAPACAWAGYWLTQSARTVSRKRRAPPGAAKEGTQQ